MATTPIGRDTSGGIILQRTVAPGAYLPRDTQVEIAAGLGTHIQSQTAVNSEILRVLQDIRATLGAQASFATSPAVASAARTAQSGVNATQADLLPDFVPGASSVKKAKVGSNLTIAGIEKTDLRPARVVSTADVRESVVGDLGQMANDSRVASYKAGRQQGIKGIRDQVTNRIAQAVSEMTFGGDYYEQVEVPQSYDAPPGHVMDRSFINLPTNEPTQQVWVNRQTNQVVEPSVADKAMKAVTRANAARQVVGALGRGEGLSAGVAAAVPKLALGLGYVGMGVTAVQQGYQQYARQFEANRPYQQVLGGSANEGFGERLSQNAFRIRNALSFNPIGSAQSEAIYQGALQTYAGDKDMRGVAQDAMTGLLRSTGMTPEQSLAVIKIAAEEGNTAIGTIARSLKSVTETAREAGLNAEEARDRFTATYRALAETVGGAGASALASAQTQAVTGMGRGFQGVGLDSGETRMMLVGASNGMNPGEVANTAAMDPLAFARLDQAQRTQEAERYLASIGATPEVARYLQSIGKTDGQGLKRGEMQELAAIVNRRSGSPGSVKRFGEQFLGLTGLTLANAGEAVIASSFGQPDVAGAMEDELGQFEATPFEIKGSEQDHKKAQRELLKKMGFSDKDAKRFDWSSPHSAGKQGAIGRYFKQVQQTGQRNPVLERLLTDYDNDRRFQVHTKSGDKVVGNFELIENFADQAAAGDVEIVKGDGKGGSIEEMLGVDLKGFSEDTKSASKKYKGKTFDKEDDKGSGEIIIRAGPELQKWIDISATGSASYAGARVGEPSTGLPNPDRRATG